MWPTKPKTLTTLQDKLADTCYSSIPPKRGNKSLQANCALNRLTINCYVNSDIPFLFDGSYLKTETRKYEAGHAGPDLNLPPERPLARVCPDGRTQCTHQSLPVSQREKG